MLTEEQRFRVRYYLGFPDLTVLPVAPVDEDQLMILTRSQELETRMDNLSTYAEQKVVEILDKLDMAILEIDEASSRFPFKRIEDITFREDELSVRLEANATLIGSLSNILGTSSMRTLNPSSIGIEVV